ncbi:MAG: protein kinase [Gemmataceae bacterium]|nr:protein kinase [Gemmataceae bacterium]
MSHQTASAKQFGPYEVLEKLGHGGTAVVYKGRHSKTGAVVALKIMPDSSIADPTIEKRFRREFDIARNLTHPHLVRAIEYGEIGDYLYQALEFVTGKNLDRRVRDGGPLPMAEAVRIFSQVTDALQCLHDHGVVHRDIKPSNIMLEADGAAKLGDFGLLKNVSAQASVLTRSRQSLGTLGYGAPEQFEDAKHIDHRCDLYSLAATFYTALTGQLPFGSGGNLKILRRKLLNQFVPLGELAQVDADLNEFISRSLNARPQLRPNSCAEFVACLDRQRLQLAAKGSKARVTPVHEPKDEPDDEPDDTANRRRADRRPVELAATCEPMFDKGRQNWTAAVVDLSMNGLCLRASCSFPIDTILQVQLQTTEDPSEAWHLVRVRWVKPSARKTWNIGCILLHPLSAARFEAMQEAGVPKKVVFHSGEPVQVPA